MLNFTHTQTGYPFKMVAEWSDMTLEQAMKLRNIDLEGVEIKTDLYEKPDTVNELWRLLTTVKDVNEVSYPERVHYAWTVLLPFVHDLRAPYPATFTPSGVQAFKHEGRTFYLPNPLEMHEETLLSYDMTAKRFTESATLLSLYSDLSVDGIKFMPVFIASFVVEEYGEEWNEFTIMDRAKLMRTLPMQYVWEVFFCALERFFRYQKSLKTYSKEAKAAAEEIGLPYSTRLRKQAFWEN